MWLHRAHSHECWVPRSCRQLQAQPWGLWLLQGTASGPSPWMWGSESPVPPTPRCLGGAWPPHLAQAMGKPNIAGISDRANSSVLWPPSPGLSAPAGNHTETVAPTNTFIANPSRWVGLTGARHWQLAWGDMGREVGRRQAGRSPLRKCRGSGQYGRATGILAAPIPSLSPCGVGGRSRDKATRTRLVLKAVPLAGAGRAVSIPWAVGPSAL